MRIAVLAFGSLVHNLTSVHYGHTLEVTKYPSSDPLPPGVSIRPDSPFLPALGLELPALLGRLSSADTPSRRFTMVLEDGAQGAPVFFAISRKDNLGEAIDNLAAREGLRQGSPRIGYVNLQDQTYHSRISLVAHKVTEWARGRFDAVIWTDLEGNFDFPENFTGEEILEDLRNDCVLLANTKAYVNDLPGPLTSVQKTILELS